MKVFSWNVNSIRIRKAQLLNLINKESPDFICLQETKTLNEQFPISDFEKINYKVYTNGISSYNGVAIITKHNLEKISVNNFCNKNDARHIQAKFGKLSIHSIYVPAGGDEPDEKKNEKFLHKLKFLDEMGNFFSSKKNELNLLCGDFNVAPYEDDVWSHKQLRNVVSHTDIERKKLLEILNKGNFMDAVRIFNNPPENIFTWWSYRSKDFNKNNRGRRLDHIWITKDEKIKIKDSKIFKDSRNNVKPSDHVPISMDFEIL